ncbi:hypothetical protein BN1723_009513 [Verticillium longisporum]|uniref:Alpha/beta hydrolase fold-3 domain-containing protein n=1 Tax=Verticillium longisporum TaxID=100787 RepID=A0A0G4KQ11_VERLO|nr:hypothetical protein BN1723_009513 [Verticillium longisporum]
MSTALRCPAAPQAASPLSDLHNTSHIPSTVPLVVHLPPFAPIPGADPHLPDFLAPFPTAVINYRWTGPSSLTSSHTEPSTQDEFKAPLYWPTPLHDVLFAYSWLLENLRPENQARRAIYLYGTYLGATLAAALALTESHKHEPTAVRGFAAYNGVYNWTMFLPDHKLNKPTTYRGKTTPVPPPEEGSALRVLRDAMPDLFGAPVSLFDAFASPSLFFQTAGLEIPPSFTQTVAVAGLVDRMAALGLEGSAADLMPASVAKVPRRSALVFPPRKSTLGIPSTLLVHDAAVVAAATTSSTAKRKTTSTVAVAGLVDRMAALGLEGSAADLMPASVTKVPRRSALVFPPRKSTLGIPSTLLVHDAAVVAAATTSSTAKRKTTSVRRRKAKGNQFEAQAEELAGLMRRSMEKLELKERMKWDEDFDAEGEMEARVKVVDVGDGSPHERKAKGNQFEAQAEELAGLMRRSMEKLELKERMKWDEDFDAEGEMEARVKVVDVALHALDNLKARLKEAFSKKHQKSESTATPAKTEAAPPVEVTKTNAADPTKTDVAPAAAPATEPAAPAPAAAAAAEPAAPAAAAAVPEPAKAAEVPEPKTLVSEAPTTTAEPAPASAASPAVQVVVNPATPDEPAKTDAAPAVDAAAPAAAPVAQPTEVPAAAPVATPVAAPAAAPAAATEVKKDAPTA